MGRFGNSDRKEMSVEAGSESSGWKPIFKFKPYVFKPGNGTVKPASPPFVVRLTTYIAKTYQACNPNFKYSNTYNPKRYLTNPSNGVQNHGLDNKNSDLILAVNDTLINAQAHPNHSYVVKEMLGHGTFGQVVKCWADDEGTDVAVKIIKNQPAYYQQALVEIEILTMLNRNYDPDDNHHIVRILDFFLYKGHLCIAFELLSFNLFELIKVKRFRGISLQLLRLFTKQILDALGVLREARVIHCDLKPENILLSTSLQSGEIKLIDFGSACQEHRTVYSYIQSRFYRCPEVVLGHPYTTAIDMWSLGCVAAELFLGLPLFPGDSEYDLLQRMIETLGCQPSDHLLRKSKNTSKYFKNISAAPPVDGAHGESTYRFLTEKEYESRENDKPAIGKRYFKYKRLEDIIKNYPFRSSLAPEEIEAEKSERIVFVDFLRGLVQFDPARRWTPHQASQHPFITEEPYVGPFQPMSETPRTPVLQFMSVEHNPGAGHWFAAGLSPQVSHLSGRMPYGSPQYPAGPFSYASSYGSYGSCEGVGLPGSYGSYNDMYLGYATPPQFGMVDSWRRIPPNVPPGYGLGMSPSNNTLKPMSLGGSPSQFTPPGSTFPSPGSTFPSPGSPSSYGPTSPARLGKAAAVGQFNRRRGFNPPSGGGFSPSDGVLGQRPHSFDQRPLSFDQRPHSFDQRVHGFDVHGENYSARPHGQSHLKPPKRAQQHSKKSSSYKANTIGAFLSTSDSIAESQEASSYSEPVTDWGDWDPNLGMLLQDEGDAVASSGPAGVMGSGGARLGPGQGYTQQTGFWKDSTRTSDPPWFQGSPQASSSFHDPYHHHAFSSPQNSSYKFQHQLPQQQHHHFQQPPSLIGHSSGGFTAGFQRPPSTTEQIDRHLNGITLSSGQV